MVQKVSLRTALATAALVLLGLSATAQATWQVNLLSDIHFDPVYGTANAFGANCKSSAAAALGQQGCDAPAALIESTVADLTAQSSDLSIYAGDWQRHGFNPSVTSAANIFTPFSKDVMSIVTSGRVQTPAFATSWGNNDVVPDYEFNAAATSQPELQERVDLMRTEGVFTAEDAASFAKCAFYARRTENLSVIVLHTLIWSHNLKPPLEEGNTDPCGQFAFLTSELADARTNGRKVIIVGHIPPVLDVYNVLSNANFTTEERDMFWKSSFQQTYEQTVAANKDIVKLQVFGHTHLFGLFAFANVGVPSIILPAITPLFGNIPAYLVGTFSNDWDLQELQMRFLQDGKWVSGLSVKGALGLANGFMDIPSLQASLYDLSGDNRTWNNYLQLHSGGVLSSSVYPKGSCDAFCRMVSTCMLVNSTYDDVKGCVNKLAQDKPGEKPDVPVNLSGSIITAVLLLGVVVSVAVIIVLYHLIPKIRAGEMKLSNFDFDFRAELLNSIPKKEKLRRQAAAEERRAAQYRDGAHRASQHGNAEALSHPAARDGEEDAEMVSVPVASTASRDRDGETFGVDRPHTRE